MCFSCFILKVGKFYNFESLYFFLECVALFDYSGQVGDLEFKEGDVIQIINNDPEAGWWEGSCNGQTGMFPANYVEVKAPTETPVETEPSHPVEHTPQVNKWHDFFFLNVHYRCSIPFLPF